VTLPTSRFDYLAPVPAARDLGVVHFIAIGGAGMSGVARVLIAQGISVTGSDARDSAVVAALAEAGARVWIGHDAAHVEGADTVVVSSAIREDNPELAAARAGGLRILHRSQALAATMTDTHWRIAVAGANGKTTTTALFAYLLTALGEDPSFVVGGELVGGDLGVMGNARWGAGPHYVVEADESDGSFLVYHPHIAVVTSVQPDHLDYYGTAEVVEEAYRAFVATIPSDGLLVVCVDDPGAAQLGGWAQAQGLRVVGYGTSHAAEVRVNEIASAGLRSSARLHVGGADYLLDLPLPGAYNVRNAAAVVAAAAVGLGLEPRAVVEALREFPGVRRRFEHQGTERGVDVVDDYAHNPAKVAAAVSTGRRIADERGGRFVAVFQPHLYSRTKDFAAEFGAALAGADVVRVLDVYAAREDPMPGVSGALVAAAVHAVAPDRDARFIADREAVLAELDAMVRPGDLVGFVGAGDVNELGPALLARLAAGSAPR
jgi:UDP-N-acetylmuramate--alanine ligase